MFDILAETEDRYFIHSCSSSSSNVTRFGKIRHFGESLQIFGQFLTVYLLFGKMLNLLWQICDIIGLIFIVGNGQILKNNLTIWSHCQCRLMQTQTEQIKDSGWNPLNMYLSFIVTYLCIIWSSLLLTFALWGQIPTR